MKASGQHFLSVLATLLAVLFPVSGDPNATWIKETLMSHFSEPRHHVTNPDYKMAAKNFIEDQFRSMNLTTVTHTINTESDDVKGVNVIGVLKGVDFGNANDSIVAISAHYDTVRNTPGVNDNGAAVVVMLEAARELALKKPRTSTVLFIAFDFEEWESEAEVTRVACGQGGSHLCGSTRLVADWLPKYFHNGWPLTWKGLANMDTVLNFDDSKNSQHFPQGLDVVFPDQVASVNSDQKEGDFLTMAGRTPEDNDILRDFKSSWVGQGNADFEMEMFPIPTNILNVVTDFSRSDHASFWEKDLPAIFLTDTANFRGYMQQCYHAGCDNITFVTEERLQFAAKIAGALVAWVDLTAPHKEDTSAAALPSADKMWTLVAAFVVTMTSQLLFRHRLG